MIKIFLALFRKENKRGCADYSAIQIKERRKGIFASIPIKNSDGIIISRTEINLLAG